MRGKYLSVLVVLLALVEMVGIASAAVVDFSNLSATGTGFSSVGSTLTHDGFVFSSTPSIYGGDLGVWQESSPNHPSGGPSATSLLEYYGYAQTTMTEVNNNAFDLNAIDLAPWGAQQYGTFAVTFSGTKSDKSVVQQTFTVNNSDGLTPILQHFVFNGFNDLVSLSFPQGESEVLSTAYQFNNIAVNQSPVPLPAALLLFGTGIAGMFVARMRKMKI